MHFDSVFNFDIFFSFLSNKNKGHQALATLSKVFLHRYIVKSFERLNFLAPLCWVYKITTFNHKVLIEGQLRVTFPNNKNKSFIS